MSNQVNISITATPNKYCAILAVEKDGMVHKKVVAEDRKASINSNTLQAAIEALKALNRPCMLDLYVNNDYMTGPIRNGWLTEWQRNGWRNARGPGGQEPRTMAGAGRPNGPAFHPPDLYQGHINEKINHRG